MVENKIINDDNTFEEIMDELEENIRGNERVSEGETAQLLSKEVVEDGDLDESFEEIATDFGVSIYEHEQLDKKEKAQEARRLYYKERAKILSKQERLQEKKEAQLFARERNQKLRAQALEEQEKRQEREEARLASEDESSSETSLGGLLFFLVIMGFCILLGVNVTDFNFNSNSNSSTMDLFSSKLSGRPFKKMEIPHSPIEESDYILGENESIYPWTLEEFMTISIPEMLVLGNSAMTLDNFVEHYGLASEASYNRSSTVYDTVSLTYHLSDTESLKFSFMFYNSRYYIFSKEYDGFENPRITDYWKDKTGKSWGLADYHSLRKNTNYKTKDGNSLTEIVDTFGAPSSYQTSAYRMTSSDQYQMKLEYHLDDGSTISLSFSSDSNDITDYYLSSYSIEAASVESSD